LEARVARRTRELAQVNRDLHTLIQSSRDAILFVDPELCLSVINGRALALLSLPGTVSDWKGRPVQALVAELAKTAPDVAAAVAKEAERLRRGARLSGEVTFAIAHTFLHGYTVPVPISEEEVAHLVVLRDISRQRQAEQMQHDMIRAMVHDLRNPLSNVMTSLETVQWLDIQGKGSLTAAQQRSLRRSLVGAQQMSHLIDNILDVSRLESGQMPLTRTAVSLQDLIAAVVDSQRPIAAEKQLRLSHAVAPDLPPAWVDAELLERVLQNLLDNAIKFTPSGGEIRVTARLAPRQDSFPLIEIQVADTGPGIARGLRQKLFQKFATGQVKGAGSGLGLAFAKLAVEAHGGEIWVDSPPDGGAVFRLTVPVRRRS
jgi:signal transduction histidine kinase